MNAYIMPTGFGWEPYRTLDNDERLACWAAKYFSAGHHRRPRTSSNVESGLIETLDEYSRGECLTGQYIQEGGI